MANANNSLMRREVPVGSGYGRQEAWHAHLDIKGTEPLSVYERTTLAAMKHDILKDFGLTIDDQPFCRLRPEQYSVIQTVSDDIASMLSNPDLYGDPLAHWTLKTGHAPFTGRAVTFQDAFLRIAEFARRLDRPAYVEVERVKRVAFPFASSSQHQAEWPRSHPIFPIQPLRLVSLMELGREFRDTEVHITIEKLEATNPALFLDLFQRIGFRIAHRERADGGFSIIATAQGFEPDVSQLFLSSLEWAKCAQESDNIRCAVTVKMEEIVWHQVMNSPYILPVIVPGSLRRLA